MDAERWIAVKEIVAGALERSPDDRAGFLRSACNGDAEVRAEVDALLGEEDRAGSFLLDSVLPGSGRNKPLAPGEILAGRFEILRAIGQGGMGDVYAARDRQLGETVALKTVRPALAADEATLALFKSEIQLAKRVTHPNVCRIHDLGVHDGASPVLFFTMELLEGETLATALQRGPMAPDSALPLIAQMCAALAAAHETGVVHRDFKPANVILVNGRAVVTDFGLARPADPSPERAAVAGTPDYMAPEQFTSGAITPATDIYALGVVIYEMVTGRRPFEAETFLEAALQRVQRPPVPPRQHMPALDVRWERVILRCLGLAPETRFARVKDVAEALAGGGSERPAMPSPCPDCGHTNPEQAHFCDKCGRNLRRFWIVGSGRDCHIVVEQSTVSGRHCRLTEMGSGYVVEDLGSRNGTYLDGRRLTESVTAAWGANITLGTATPLPWEQVEIHPARKVLRIGRAPDNDVVLDHDLVSAHHARLLVVGDSCTIEDLGSTNGTAVGTPHNRISSSPLDTWDVVYFGTLPIPAARLLTGRVVLGRQPHVDVSLAGSIVLGRDPACQKPLDDPMISWRHARLSQENGEYRIEDLGSTNGTFVNDRRIDAPTAIAVGDVIGLGSYTFQFTGGSTFQERDYRGNMTVEARGVTVDVPGRRLIDDMSLTIFPSEIVGLMGVAGAGKTTLMSALNGYARPTAGAVLLNGQDLYRNPDQFRGRIGYSPQDDIMHRELTVFQALYYTARLRLPTDYTDALIRKRIADVLSMLAMEGTEQVIIGSPERKGISGGQRKRVNLAMELLTDPDVLFLDEPTSGLSSEDAYMVMRVLRRLADAGKTILITIHQPSLDVFRLMDTLAVIAKDKNSVEPGRLVYFGPAYPDAVDFFNPGGIPGARPGVDPSPDEMLRGLAKQPSAAWVERYSESRFKRDYVDARAGKQPATPAAVAPSAAARPAPQFGTLAARCLAVKLQDRAYTGLLLGQSLFVALLVVFVCGAKEKSMAVFGLIMAALFSGCLNASREIVGEWAVYRRERMVGLRLAPYIASKLAVLGGLCVLQCAILAGVVGFGCELDGAFPAAAGVLTLASLVALGYGLIVSAISRTSERAVALILPVLMPMLLLGGALPKLHDTTRPVARLLPSRWAFEAMLQVQNLDVVRKAFFPDNDQFDVASACVILAGMLTALIAILAIVLRGRDAH